MCPPPDPSALPDDVRRLVDEARAWRAGGSALDQAVTRGRERARRDQLRQAVDALAIELPAPRTSALDQALAAARTGKRPAPEPRRALRWRPPPWPAARRWSRRWWRQLAQRPVRWPWAWRFRRRSAN